jgi:pilus assembly protein CpaC
MIKGRRMKTAKKTIRKVIFAVCCLGILVLLGGPVCSQLFAQVISDSVGKEEPVTIVLGQSQVIKAPWATGRVAVTDSTIANVQILTPDQILLQGLKVGSTDLILWSKDEAKILQMSVRVTLDGRQILSLFPRCQLDVHQSGDVVVIRGLLRSADQAAQLKEYLDKSQVKYVNMTSLAGIQQVKLQVRVAEVSRTAIRALGINAMMRNNDVFFATRPGTNGGGALVDKMGFAPAGGQSAMSKLDFTTTDFALPSSLTAVVGVPRADLEVFFQALAENQYLRILASPTLIALSGEEASFLAGGEFPIPVPQSGGGAGGTTITIEYKEFGVRLKFRPTVLGDGTIRLYTAPEVSEMVTSVNIEGFQIPTLTTRKVETTIELKSGQTFAMAGLMRSKVNAINSRLPGLGDLPVIGTLFRSVRYANDETEMVVLVTADLVEPMNYAEAPPVPGFLHKTPNDWEFYIDGRLEAKEPARISTADADWLRQMGLDKLMGPGAWDSYDNSGAPSQADIAPQTGDTARQSRLDNRNDTQSVAYEMPRW